MTSSYGTHNVNNTEIMIDINCYFNKYCFILGQILITVNNCQDILYAAHMLSLNAVIHMCCKFLVKHLHPENAIGMVWCELIDVCV